MKYRVIKEYAGIEVGSIVGIADGAVKYMVGQGYVEPIQVEEKQNVTFEISGSKLRGVLDKLDKPQNKAIEPKYKRNKLK